MKKFLSASFILFLFTPLVWADDFELADGERAQFTDETFILDSDDTGGDLTLQFGTTLSETIIWDNINTRFTISNDLNFGGNQLVDFRVENLSAAPTCDSNTNGRIYYNTVDTNTYVCNGTTWNQIDIDTNISANDLPATQARRTTQFTLPAAATFYDVPFDQTDVETDASIIEHNNTNTERIDVKEDGLYMVYYLFTSNDAAVTHQMDAQVVINNTTVVPGSTSVHRNFQDEFASITASTLVSLTNGDYVTFQVSREAANILDPEIKFSVVKLQGSKGSDGADGAQGPQGLPGSVGLGTNETSFTIDQDNVGAGVNIDFIAEQGTDPDGTLRYDTTANEWQISNDGGSFAAIATAPRVAQVYESGTTTFDAATSIVWDGTDTSARFLDSDYAHTVGTSTITVNTAGLYEISYSIAWDTTANARRTATCVPLVNGGAVTTGIGTSHDYSRNTTDNTGSNSATFVYNFADSDTYEISCSSTGTTGSITTLAGQSWTNIKRLR